MEESENKVSWIQDAAKKGLILGFIHIILFILIYFLAPNKLTGFSYVFAIIAINLGYGIYQTILYRNQIGGFLSYGGAFKYSLVLLVVNGILGIVFSAIFLIIEPSFPDIMAQSQLDTSIYWAEKMGAPGDAIEQMRDSFNKEDITKRYSSFTGFLMSFGIALIFYCIGAVIIALFGRKNQPETF